ncbi:MAG: PD40 domain-containing protein [Candidatus Eisenbacteria bacterium]|nr:PD40 domain-containing protein [Candidatus Eisenbacteria bacterium]
MPKLRFPAGRWRPILLAVCVPALLLGCSRGNRLAPFPVAAEIQRLSRGAADAPEGLPSWSSDGSKMYLPRHMSGGWRLCEVDVASGEVRALTDPPPGTLDVFPQRGPATGSSPNLVVFVRAHTGSAGYDSLMVVDVVTGESRTLQTRGSGVPAAFDNMDRPLWSSDGRRILFGGGPNGAEHLWVLTWPELVCVDVAGDFSAPRYTSVCKYAWGRVNPASEPGVFYKITYEAVSNGDTRIGVILLRSGCLERKLLNKTTLGASDCGTQIKTDYEFSPSFSPDGARVIFACNYVIAETDITVEAICPDSLSLLVRNVPRVVDLASSVRCNEFAAWSPDGNSLAIEAGAEGGSQLWLRRIADRNAVQLTAFPNGVGRYFAAWSPDGRTIAVMERVPVASKADSTTQRVTLVRGF